MYNIFIVQLLNVYCVLYFDVNLSKSDGKIESKSQFCILMVIEYLNQYFLLCWNVFLFVVLDYELSYNDFGFV